MTGMKLYEILGELEEGLLIESSQFCGRRRRLHPGTVAAACLCLILCCAALRFLPSIGDSATDIEPRRALTLEEAAQDQVFGSLFPTRIPEGYVLEEAVGIFGHPGNEVLSARFYSRQNHDQLLIQISSREWYLHQHREPELNTVLYRETTHGTGSRIYLEVGDRIILYSFTTTDLKSSSEFLPMLLSAAHFQQEGGKLQWCGDQLIRVE